jgi:hypothetical protein
MSATYTRSATGTPSLLRTVLIENVEAGDKIDMLDVLGRPANGMAVTTGGGTDVVTYRLNNRSVLTKRLTSKDDYNGCMQLWGQHNDGSDPIVFWDEIAEPFSTTGQAWQTADALKISSVQIVSITGSATITIVVW